MGLLEKVEKTLSRLDDYIAGNKSLDWVISAFDSSFKYRVEPYRHAKKEGDLETLRQTEEHLFDYCEKLRNKQVQDEDRLKDLKEILQNPDLQLIFNKYSQYMSDRLPHSERVGAIFNNTASHISENDVMALVDTLTHSNIMSYAAQIDEGAFNIKHRKAGAFLHIATSCPAEQKEECFYSLDTNPYFQASMRACKEDLAIAETFSSLLESNSTEDALRMLKNSETWPSIPKTSSLGQSLLSADKRLMPAMNFEAYQHTPQHNL